MDTLDATGATVETSAEKFIGFKYLPDLGAYNALTQVSENQNFQSKLRYFQSTKKAFDSQREAGDKKSTYGSKIQIHKQNVLFVQTSDDTSLTKNPQSSNSDTGGYNVEERIAINNAKFNGRIVDAANYFNHLVTGEYIKEKHYRAIPLPMKLELTIYGISSLKPGDVFRVDYLPQVYLDACYFQVMKVSHSVNSDGWYTTLETQFRVAPHKYQDDNSIYSRDISAEDKRTELENAIREELGLTDSTEENALLIEKIINQTVITDTAVNNNNRSALDPGLLKGGKDGLLVADINDRNAYIWDQDAHGFSVRFVNGGGLGTYPKLCESYPNHVFHRRPKDGEFAPRYKIWPGSTAWDYVEGYTSKGVNYMSGDIGTVGGKFYNKAIINKDFETLTGFMTNLQKEDESPYYWFSRLFSFELAAEYPVLINNPLYYWSEQYNRYNGYGNFTNTFEKNGKYTYVGGVYMPGEKCYLIINKTHGAAYHWAVIPQVHSDMSTNHQSGAVQLEDYNVTTQSENWSDSEWADEGWGGPPNGKYPSSY